MSKMLLCLLFLVLVQNSFSDPTSSHYCADIEPQSKVNIQQLMGMWYGIEIISHVKNEKTIAARKRTATACPVLKISEDTSVPTISPLYQDYKYDQQYGTGYGYTDPRYNQPTRSPYDDDWYFRDFFQRVHIGTISEKERKRYLEEIKRLSILWDENGIMTEYTVRYNVTQPGVWIASGPKNGSLLEEKFNNFAGTIQVFKAVGNHIVLTFCHRMPEEQLVTVLLSRFLPLPDVEINGVHSQLDRKGLEMVSITKVCSGSSRSTSMTLAVLLLLYFHLFCY